MPRLHALASLLAAALLLGPGTASAGEPRRWPLWPTEVARVAEPLRAPPAGELRLVPEGRRAAAVRALDRFPTPLVEDLFVELLGDRSGPVRREVLQACLERQMVACAPGARQIWRAEIMEPALRIPALRVVALAGGDERLQIFLAALRDPDETIRAEAARTLATVIWPKDHGATIRSSVVAKLADPAPAVRRGAAFALGVLGPGEGALALARLLSDPDPQVRHDVAEALARLRDPRAGPALLRALQAGDEAFVARACLGAFAALPGPDTDAELLRLLDAPPRNLSHRAVAEAIARRPGASEALAEGLVVRLREDALRGPALDALLGLGAAARPALTAALGRGLEAPLELEVRRLLAALEPPAQARPLDVTWPEDQDVAGWQRALAAPDLRARLRAAAALGERDPAWLAGAATLQLERGASAAERRPWLVALAGAAGWTPEGQALPVTLRAWARDRRLASGDRCLALAALARARPARELTRETLATLSESPDDALRACVAGLLHDAPRRSAEPLLAGLLRDPSARVRSAAALALACREGAELAAPLALLAARDPDPAVLTAAALARGAPRPCARWTVLVSPDPPAGAFVPIRWRDRDLLAPAETLGALALAWGPGLGEASLRRVPAAAEAPSSPRLFPD